MSNGQFALKFKNFKREAKLVDKRSTMSLNEMGKDAYYFSVVDLKDKFFVNDAEIKEEFVGLRALFFLDLKNWAFREITIPKSIDS